jgi:hypothetical protein
VAKVAVALSGVSSVTSTPAVSLALSTSSGDALTDSSGTILVTS